MQTERTRRRLPALVRGGVLLVAGLLLIRCGSGDDADASSGDAPVAATTPQVRADDDLPVRFVDVAAEWNYTLRNVTGKDADKDLIVEAMPPGIAVADYDADGDMDLFCANGNLVVSYDRHTKKVNWLEGDKAPRNELYWNEGGKTFRPGGKDAGVDDSHWAFGCVAGDIDNDGDPDIYCNNWGPNLLFLNDGKGRFTEVGESAGVAGDPLAWSTGSCLFDYDHDGDLDIYVAQFADMREFLENRRHIKIDKDGKIFGRTCEWKKLQVYCGPIGLPPLNDVLLQNQLVETGTLSFKDVTKEMGVWIRFDERSATDNSAGPFYGFQPVSWDIDRDGWPDVFVANDSVANLCWMNEKGKRFRDDAQAMGLAMSASDFNPQASMGVGVGDLNVDGQFDVVVTHFSHDQSNLLIAERLPSGMVLFNEKAVKSGFRELTFFKLSWGTVIFDMDLDGDLDWYICCGHVYPEVDQFATKETTYRQTNLLIRNLDAQRLKLEDVSARAGPGLQVAKVSRSAVQVDLDADGDMDIAEVSLNDTPVLLRNDLDRTRAPHHWLMVRLRGRPSAGVPLDPAGAEVSIEAGDLKASRVFLIGSSFMSSEDPRLHFGLGTHDRVDRIEVIWPDGKRSRTVLENVEADRLITIEYPDSR